MIEYILVAVIAILCAFMAWTEHNNRKERKSMLNMIVSKTNSELVNLELAENTKIEAPTKEELPNDYIPTDAVSDDDYIKMIKKTI